MNMYLDEDEMKKKIEKKDLVEDYIHLETQLRDFNFDLTVSKIEKIKEKGKIDFSNSERETPSTVEVQPKKKSEEDDYGWWILPRGDYVGKVNETINLPEKTMMIQQPRLSVAKSGVDMSTRVMAGKDKVKPEFCFSVTNREGFEVKENARMVSVFFLEFKESPYGGID